jgi:hypothetical protein
VVSIAVTPIVNRMHLGFVRLSDIHAGRKGTVLCSLGRTVDELVWKCLTTGMAAGVL